MSTHRARRIALALGCMVLPHKAAAQIAVTPGARVRVVDVSSNSPLIVGELVRLVGDSVTISPATTLPSTATQTVSVVSGQRRLEVSSLRRHTQTGMTVGMLAGIAIGGAIDHSPRNCARMSSTCVGLLAGTLIGGIVGHSLTSEIWQRVDYCLVCVGIAPTSRGMLLTASVAF